MRVVFFIIIPLAFSFGLKNIISSSLDFAPVVGNIKGVCEAVYGKDIITGEKLSKTDRALSLLGAVPFGNYLKNGKHLKNGQKFMKAAQRAQKVGKLKNAANFAKASARAFKKAESIEKTIKSGAKLAKTFFKQFEDKKENEGKDRT